MGNFVFLIIVGVSALATNRGMEFAAGKVVLTATPTPVPSATPTPTPTSTPTPKPTAKPTAKPTPAPTKVPQPKFSSEQIYQMTDRFGGQYGVDANVLRHIARCESGMNPAATNSIYGGLYQFDPSTWRNYRKMMGEDANADLRFNAEEAIQAAAYALSLNRAYIWPNCVPH
ncbi:TPA: hypothetical protein DCZ90_04115 [Candidatus Amesbacteria bacterium]|nr:hypothetical protein [Candidatus Amesbacteria bacterium]